MIKLELTSKFCPFCSNSKAVDGSYQEIGTFAVMEKWQVRSYSDVVRAEFWACDNCGHQEMIWGIKMIMPKEGVKNGKS